LSKDTMISWCDSTLNLMMGCGGCELWNGARRSCYAGVMTAKYSGQKGWPSAFNSPQLFPHRLPEALAWPDLTGQDRPGKPWLNGMSRLIFLNDMGDTFTEELPLDWLRPHLLQMEESPHRWLILTKRPRRMRRFFEQVDVIPNAWLGVSVTDQATADARIPELLRVPVHGNDIVRFVSVEPLLGPVDMCEHLWALDWVIVGGESGAGFRPMKPEWVQNVWLDCENARVPFFYKQDAALVTETRKAFPHMEQRGMPR